MKAVAVSLFLISFIVGCGSVQSEKLPGSWQLARQEAFLKSKMDESHSEREIPKTESFFYVFDQNSLSVPAANGQSLFQASYRLDGKNIIVQGKDGSYVEFEIQELNDETLKIEKKTKQGDREDRLILTFKRVGSLPNSGVVNPSNDKNTGPLSPSSNGRLPAPGNTTTPQQSTRISGN